MDKNKFKEKFDTAISVLNIFEKAGYEAYFVGGCVRDYLLGTEFSDIDITTNALPEEVKKLFNRTIDTGLQHGTVTILVGDEVYEVTTFRTEAEYTNHRAPDKVEFVRNLKDDLDRRDFSINAMALNSNGEIYDFHNGQLDLQTRIIKTVNDPNERFFEDALRMLRAFRFSSKLNFAIEEETFLAIKKNAKLIKFVSIERIVNEFKKLLAGVGNENAMKKLLDSELNKYIPVINEVTKYRDFVDFSFCQSLFYLIYFNDIDISKLKLLKLSNNEIKKIKTYKKIKEKFDSKIPIEVILYKHEKEDVKFILDIFNFPIKENIDDIKLNIISFNDVECTSEEIIEIIGIKPGPWIKDLISEIEELILLSKLDNSKKAIEYFLLNMRDNI